MKEILSTLERWRDQGEDIALATVVRTVGSSPRPVGAKMAVTGSTRMVGSVSGGCVEGAVSEEAIEILRSGQPKLLTFGVADEEAWAVGLSCGGTIEVFVEPFDLTRRNVVAGFVDHVRGDRPVALATLIEGGREGVAKMLLDRSGRREGSLGNDELDARVRERTAELFTARRSGTLELDGVRVFIDVHIPLARLVIVGAVHIAVTLSRLARELGFRVVVCDARGRFATRERFPNVDELILGWPDEVLPKLELDEFSHVVVITHDAKLDNPALIAALASPAPYVGALGSKRTHARRVRALQEAGVSDQDIARIHAPVGLDIGARTPEEIALATLAEIVAIRNRPTRVGP